MNRQTKEGNKRGEINFYIVETMVECLHGSISDVFALYFEVDSWRKIRLTS